MKSISHRQLVTLLIMSLLVTGTVGCGNSKKGKHRTRINGQDINAKADADAAAAAAADTRTPEEKAADEEAEAAAAAEQEKQDKLIAEVVAVEKAVLGDASQVEAKDLPVGLYTLTDVATSFKYERQEADDKAAEKLLVVGQGKVEIVKEDDKAKDVKIGVQADSLAGIMSDSTDSERKIDIAIGFNVIDGAEKFSRKEDRSLNGVLKTRFNGTALEKSITLGGDDQLAASLMSLLNVNAESDDQGEVRMVKDGDKTIALRLFKASDSKYIAYITIDEQTGEESKIRNVYLTYSLTTASSATAESVGNGEDGTVVSTQ